MIPAWIIVTYIATDTWRAIMWHTQKDDLQKAQSLISSCSRRHSWESIPHADRDHKLRKSSIFIYIHVLQLYSHIVVAVMQDDFTYTHLNSMPIYFILAVLHTSNTGSDDFVNQKWLPKNCSTFNANWGLKAQTKTWYCLSGFITHYLHWNTVFDLLLTSEYYMPFPEKGRPVRAASIV